jgi:mono/diheme cytochrome c family protein
MKKIVLSLVIGFFCIACAPKKTSDTTIDAQALWRQNCVLCHGINGKLQVNGAKDLSLSKLTKDERVVVITKGRNTMASYEHLLSKEQIKALAEYTMSFK